jgi:hypothetical protein
MSRTMCAAARFERDDEHHAYACLEGSGDGELLHVPNIRHERQGSL